MCIRDRYLAHRLAERLTEVRKNGTMPLLRPDGKTQVSVRYEGGRPVHVEKVVVSTQHAEEIAHDEMCIRDSRCTSKRWSSMRRFAHASQPGPNFLPRALATSSATRSTS